MDYRDRLLVEFKELIEKISLLRDFLSEEHTNIDSKQLELLRKQLEFMSGYEEILFVRIIDLMK